MAIRDAHTTERSHAQTGKLTDGRMDDWSRTPKPTGRPLTSLRWDWDEIASAMRDDALLRFYFTIFSYASSNCYKPICRYARKVSSNTSIKYYSQKICSLTKISINQYKNSSNQYKNFLYTQVKSL